MKRREFIALVAGAGARPLATRAQLQAVREKLQSVTDRFAGYQAQWLNVHVDFPLLHAL